MLLLSLILMTQPNAGIMRQLHYVDVGIEERDTGRLHIHAQAQPFLTFEQIRDPRFGLAASMPKTTLDGPLQLVFVMLRRIDRNRLAVFPDGLEKDQPLVQIGLHRSIWSLEGKLFSRQKQRHTFGLTALPGGGFMKYDDQVHSIDLSAESVNDIYRNMLGQFIASLPTEIRAPKRDSFVLNLGYRWPKPTSRLATALISRMQPTLLLFHQSNNPMNINLGRVYVERGVDRLNVYPSNHTVLLKDAVNAFSDLLEQGRYPQKEAFVAGLEDYLARQPAESLALIRLIEAHVLNGDPLRAYHLLNQNMPLLHKYPQMMSLRTSLQARMDRQLAAKLAQRSHFKKATEARLDVISPKTGDLVGGHSQLMFDIEGASSPLLHAELTINNRMIGSCRGKPYRIPFHVDKDVRIHRYKLAVYFENETYQETESWFKGVSLGDSDSVHLATIRAVVTVGSSWTLTDLSQSDFVLREKGEKRRIERFVRDEAPLNVAILLDASLSMAGEKMRNARYAVDQFTRQLEPQDSFALYSVDRKVMNIQPFTNDVAAIRPRIYTLTPNLSTALNDAIFAAHHDLQKRKGTRVMIVVSDGVDTASQSTTDQVIGLLNDSSVLVYTIYLADKQAIPERQGIAFLRSLSKATGSNCMVVEDTHRLGKSFDSIYRELKSFYILDFYSVQNEFNPALVQIKVLQMGAKARFRPFFGFLDEEIDHASRQMAGELHSISDEASTTESPQETHQ